MFIVIVGALSELVQICMNIGLGIHSIRCVILDVYLYKIKTRRYGNNLLGGYLDIKILRYQDGLNYRHA